MQPALWFFAVGQAKKWTIKRIEPLCDSGLLKKYYKMELAKSWTINRF